MYVHTGYICGLPRAGISQLVAPASHYRLVHFRVFKKYVIKHGQGLHCNFCMYKISFQNMTICDLWKKEKTKVNNIPLFFTYLLSLLCISENFNLFFDETSQMHTHLCYVE
jgi:hypothetical protein